MKCHCLLYAYLLLLCAVVHEGAGKSVVRVEDGSSAKTTTADSQHQLNQAKRDLSLSYAATDIDSKEGTRVKTITVIKNIGSNDKLVINPALHKHEEWASAFRDNFESFASIPDVPDVDDLFEFVKKRDKTTAKIPPPPPPATAAAAASTTIKAPAEEATVETVLSDKKPTQMEEAEAEKEAVEKPVKEESIEMDPEPAIMSVASTDAVDKIKGDAELIGNLRSLNNKNISSGQRSQSLRRNRARESLINFNYTTPQHSMHQYFQKYVQENDQNYVQQQQDNDEGYDYPPPYPPLSYPQQPPKPNCAPNTLTVTTPSGRTYDIPLDNNKINSGGNPYIAPAISKKPIVQPQQQNNAQTTKPVTSPTPYVSVNSILPPLQLPSAQAFTPPPSTNNNNVNANSNNNNINFQPPGQSLPKSVYSTTSQRPYVAPNVVHGIVTAKPLPTLTKPVIYSNVAGGGGAPTKHLRTNIFGAAANRPNTARSRGLKY